VLTVALCLVAAAAILWAASYPAAVGASATQRQLPIYCVQKDYKVLSITFDAAWGNEDTQQLIDIMAKYNVKATFFVVGQWVEKYPESVKALADAGHEVMSHSSEHDHFNSLSTEEILADLTACNQTIAAVTGQTPTLFRCPYGEYDDHVISAVRSLGMEPIQWDVDSLDWKDLSAADITQRVTCRVQPGSIVLFHNAALHTPEALPGIIECLLQQGYTFVPVSQLILTGEYTIDHTGRQCPT
jgi:polysaccharide deacetylase family sporulation protein PdaB